LERLNSRKNGSGARKFLPANAGKPWTNQEDALICDELRRGLSFEQIAQRARGRRSTIPEAPIAAIFSAAVEQFRASTT